MKNKKILSRLITVIAICTLVYSLYNIVIILKGYYDGQNEYNKISKVATKKINKEELEDEVFSVDFNELLKLNKDTVAWIKFQEEPKIINYPVVQSTDNEYYLWKTFTLSDNTVGSIFMDYENNPKFKDKHTIIYGHRMNNNTMFNQLHKFKDEEYWKKNSYFDIYTPDGKKSTYQIYAVSEVTDVSEIYDLVSIDDKFDDFIKESKLKSIFDTGITPSEEDYVVTLSTCLVANDNYRFVVHGVKTSEEVGK